MYSYLIVETTPFLLEVTLVVESTFVFGQTCSNPAIHLSFFWVFCRYIVSKKKSVCINYICVAVNQMTGVCSHYVTKNV